MGFFDSARSNDKVPDETITGRRQKNKTTEQREQCFQAEFPICLDRAMTKMFGRDGKSLALTIASKAGFEGNYTSSPKEVLELYLAFLFSMKNEFGRNVSDMIEIQIKREMESMKCVNCPLYVMEID